METNGDQSVESKADEIKEYLAGFSQWTFGTWDYNIDIAKDIYPIVQESMEEHMKKGISILSYGEAEGTAEYLKALAEFLTINYKDEIVSSTLFATYGATFGWMLLMTHFLRHGDFVFTEDCSFGSVIEASLAYGLVVKTMETDDEGLVISDLEKKLKYYKEKSTHVYTEEKPFWAIVFLMTICHNPKGISYSPERCQSIVKLARKFGVLVVTDDVYNFFQFNLKEGQSSTKRLVAYDVPSDENYGKGHVASNGSLTKILFPSLRLGWIETSPWIRSQLVSRPDAFIGGGFNALNQRFVATLLRNKNLPDHITRATTFYKKLMRLGCNILREKLPKEVKFIEPVGSFFIWIQMPIGCSAKLFSEKLKPYGITVCLGENYSPEGKFQNCIRLTTSSLPEEPYVLCLDVLCKEMKKFIAKHSV